MAFWNRNKKAESSELEEEKEDDLVLNEDDRVVNEEENSLLNETDDDSILDETGNLNTIEPEKKSFFKKLVSGLSKTRNSLSSGLGSIFGGSSIDEEFYEEIEEILVMSDVGVKTSMNIVETLRTKVEEEKIKEPSECQRVLIDSIKKEFESTKQTYEFESTKSVVLVVGVNGAGKTTTIGKLACKYKNAGKRVMMVAGDTFRAAASEQLIEWSNRAGVPIISSAEGSDPASVLYDALNSAKAKNIDILLCDTAGRLQNKKNLMDELRKLKSVIDKEYSDAYIEVLIVLDGTTGQNAINQAKEFKEAVGTIDGAIITKLDGSSKGGMAIALASELKIPIKYIGIGEGIDDLQKFDSNDFVEALFNSSSEDDL